MAQEIDDWMRPEDTQQNQADPLPAPPAPPADGQVASVAAQDDWVRPQAPSLDQARATLEQAESRARAIRRQAVDAGTEAQLAQNPEFVSATQAVAQARTAEESARNPFGAFGQSWGTMSPQDSAGWVPGERQTADANAAAIQQRIADVQQTIAEFQRQNGTDAPIPGVLRAQLGYEQMRLAEAQKRQRDVAAIEQGQARPPQLTTARAATEDVARALVDTAVSSIVKAFGWSSAYVANQFPGERIEPDDNMIYNAGETISRWARDTFPGDRARQHEFTTQLAQGFGSSLGFLGPGLAAKLAGYGPGAMTAISALFGGASQGSEEFDNASRALMEIKQRRDAEGNPIQFTPTERDRLVAAGLGFLIGTSEALPLAHLYQGTALRGVRGRLQQGLIQGLEEGTQEFGQNVATNAVAAQTYDPDRPLMQGVETSTGVGAIVGGVMGAGMAGGRGHRVEPPPTGPVAESVQPPAPAPVPAVPTPEQVASPEAAISGFYYPAQRAIESTQRRQGPAQAWLNDLRRAGVSQDELDSMGFPQWMEENAGRPISRDEVAEFVRENQANLVEVRQETDAESPLTIDERTALGLPGETKFARNFPAGATNPRNFLVQIPGLEYQSPHFGGPTISFIRVADVAGPNGERTLLVHGNQSELHQEAEKQGYSDEVSPNPRGWETADGRSAGVPHAPLKGDRWWQLGLKLALRQAVVEGYDSIAISTADQVKATDGNAPKSLYDQKMPSWLAKYVKPMGGVVEQASSGGATASPTVRITPKMREVITQGQPLFAAGSDRAIDPAKRWQNITTILGMGRPYQVLNTTTSSVLDGLRNSQYIRMVPVGTDVGALSRIAPINGVKPADGVIATFTSTGGREVHLSLPLRNVLGYRAMRIGPGFTSTGADAVLFLRLDPIDNVDKRLSGELRHETIHSLRGQDLIPGPAWDRLLGHANNLQVGDIDIGDVLFMVGDPEHAQVRGASVRQVYEEIYAQRSNIQEALNQEFVTHMLELHHHGFFSDEQMAPVMDVLRDMEEGLYSERGRPDSTSSLANPMAAIAGERAKTARLGALAQAKTMQSRGRNPSTTWEATGWGYDIDNKWKWEIDDSPAKLINLSAHLKPVSPTLWQRMTVGKAKSAPKWASAKTKLGTNIKLPQILQHPELYKAYPFLQRMYVNMAIGEKIDRTQVGGHLATIQKGDGKRTYLPIRVVAESATEALNTLLHEIQHYIQNVEGFAPGAAASRIQGLLVEGERGGKATFSPDTYSARYNRDQGLLAMTQAEDLARLIRHLETLESSPAIDAELKRATDTLAEVLRLTPTDYSSAAGEMEAETVAWRRTLTPLERREKMPFGRLDGSRFPIRQTRSFPSAADEVDRRSQLMLELRDRRSQPVKVGDELNAVRIDEDLIIYIDPDGVVMRAQLDGDRAILIPNDGTVPPPTGQEQNDRYTTPWWSRLSPERQQYILRKVESDVRSRNYFPSRPADYDAAKYGMPQDLREAGLDPPAWMASGPAQDAELLANKLADLERSSGMMFAIGGGGPVSVVSFIRALGGIKGARADIENIIGRPGRKGYIPGLIDERNGLPADTVRERLVEAGYLHETPFEGGPATTSVNDVFDLIDRSARGERVLPRWETDTATPPVGDVSGDILREIEGILAANDLPYNLTETEENRVVELVNSGLTVDDALERALTEAVNGYSEGEATAADGSRPAQESSGVREGQHGEVSLGDEGQAVHSLGEARAEGSAEPTAVDSLPAPITPPPVPPRSADGTGGGGRRGPPGGGRGVPPGGVTPPALPSPLAGLPDSRFKRMAMKIEETIRDSEVRVRKLVETAQKAYGKKQSDDANPYLKMTLYHGRAQEKIRQGYDQVKELTAGMKKLADELGTSISGVRMRINFYLHAQHAPERNRVHGDMAAGMDTAYAHRAIDAAKKLSWYGELKRLADIAESINGRTLTLLADGRVISAETFGTLSNTYQHHVPLNRIMEDSDDIGAVLGGRGYDVTSTGLKKAKGSEREVADILTNIVTNYEQAVLRSEKNIVDLATLAFMREYIGSMGGQIEITKPKVIGARDGVAIYENTTDEKILKLREDGKPVWIKFKDPALATAFRGTNREQPGRLMLFRAVGAFTRGYAQLHTRFNPEFALPNKLRDLQETLVYIAAQKELGTEGVKNVLKKDLQSQKDVLDFYRGLDTPGTKLYQEMRELGGTTGGFALSTREHVQLKLDALERIATSPTRKSIEAIADSFDAWNGIQEDSTRLSVYKASLAAGLTKDQAAVHAKEASINFNRFGTIGPTINAAYMFSNASMQGTWKMLLAMRNPKVAASVGLIVAMAVAAATEWNDWIDPEWRKKITKWDRQNNLNIMLPRPVNGTHYIKIPVAWGMKPLMVLSNFAYDTARGVHYSLGEMSWELMSAVLQAYNPLGGTDPMQAFLPSILRAPVEIYSNHGWSGAPIRPAGAPNTPRDVQYYSTLKDTAGGRAAIAFTQALQEYGGISWSPADVHYAVQQYAGGVGRFFLRTGNLGVGVATGDVPPAREWPFLSRFFTSLTDEEIGRSASRGPAERARAALEDDRRRLFMLRDQADDVLRTMQTMDAPRAEQRYNEILDSNRPLARQLALLIQHQNAALTATERRIIQMDVNDGTRARYLVQNVLQGLTGEPLNEKLAELRAKRIVTSQVAAQVYALVDTGSVPEPRNRRFRAPDWSRWQPKKATPQQSAPQLTDDWVPAQPQRPTDDWVRPKQ